MIDKKYHVFISSVSSEFGQAKDLIANSLNSRGLLVKVQRSFRQEEASLTTLEKLHNYIQECDAVIALIGVRSGAYPPDGAVKQEYRDMLPTGMSRASYSQWEVVFALEYGCRLSFHQSNNYKPERAVHVDASEAQQFWQDYLFDGDRGFDRTQFETRDALRANILEEYWPNLQVAKPRNVPFASIGSLFKGRDKFIQQVRDSFRSKTAKKSAIASTVIHGLGGVGKTRAAIEYALRHEDEYNALLFISGKNSEELQANIASLAGALVLNLPEREVPDIELRMAAVLRWLQLNPGWFLIIDNVDTKDAAQAVEQLLAQLSGGDVIVTARIADWSPHIISLQLAVLSHEAACSLLIDETIRRRKTTSEYQQVEQLADKLGGLALALRQAGAFINHRRLTFSSYLELFDKSAEHLMGDFGFDQRVTGYPLSVAVTWEVTFKELSEVDRDLLQVLAVFSIEPIPEALFERFSEFEALVETVQENETTDFRTPLANLESFSLVALDDDSPVFSIHRLVQQVTRDKMSAHKLKEAYESGLSIITCAIVGEIGSGNDYSEFSEQLFPHVDRFTTECKNIKVDQSMLGHLHAQYGALLLNTGRLVSAERLLKLPAAAPFSPGEVGEASHLLAIVNLALVYQAQSKFEQSIDKFQQVLNYYQPGKNNQHLLHVIGIAANNLTLLHARNGDSEKAVEFDQITQEIQSEMKNELSLRNLNRQAVILREAGRLVEAEAIWENMVSKIDEDFELRESDKADIWNSYAVLHMQKEEFSEAISCLHISLDINGEPTLLTANSVSNCLGNLAQCNLAMGDKADAIENYKNAIETSMILTNPNLDHLERFYSNLGQLEIECDHANTALAFETKFFEELLNYLPENDQVDWFLFRCAGRIISIYKSQGNFEEVFKLFEQILNKLEPQSASDSNFIPPYYALLIERAQLNMEIENFVEAKLDLEQTLESKFNLANSDDNNQSVRVSLKLLEARAHYELDEIDQARKIYTEVEAEISNSNDRNEIDLLELKSDLDWLDGNEQQSIDACRRQIDIAEKLYDKDAVELISLRFGFGLALRRVGELIEAYHHVRYALDRNRELYGEIHSETFVVKCNLSGICIESGNLVEANELADQLVQSLSELDFEIDDFEEFFEFATQAFVAAKEASDVSTSDIENQINSYFSADKWGEDFMIEIEQRD